MRGRRPRFAPDEGMTLVEVIVAAAILFFIMTAILGLVGRTTMISVQARQMNTINNAVNSYVEWVRGLPFGSVAVQPSGSLETTTIVTPDFTVQIVPTVEPILEEDGTTNAFLKNLWLSVTATRPDGTVKVLNTMVVVHDHDQYLVEGSTGPASDPVISFVGPTPPENTVVWYDPNDGNSKWRDATGTYRYLQVAVRAEASTGRSIEEIYIQGEQTWDLQDRFSGAYARWYNPSWTDSPGFYWNLNQRTSIGELLVQDGLRSVYAYVKDSAGVIRYEIRQFMVDTYPPTGIPWPIQHNYDDSMAGVLTWPVIMDGTMPAFGYNLDMRKQPATPTANTGQWLWARPYSGPDNSYVPDATPFSRYVTRSRAYSPLGRSTYWSDLYFYVTRPRLSGNYTVIKRTANPKGWTVVANLSCTTPSFETSGTTYSWYEGTTLLATTTTNTYLPPAVVTYVDPVAANCPIRNFHVVVSTQPLGPPSFAGNPAVTRESNTVSTTSNLGTITFTEGTW